MHQCAGQQAACEQLLRAVNVGHDAVEQAGALAHTGFDLAPVLRRHQHRKQVQRPRALWTVGIGIDVVGDTVVANLAVQAGRAVFEVFKTVRAENIKKAAPRRRQCFVGGGAGGQLAGFGGAIAGGKTGLAQQRRGRGRLGRQQAAGQLAAHFVKVAGRSRGGQGGCHSAGRSKCRGGKW